MTVNTVQRGGSRFYTDSDNTLSVPGVTSIISMLAKPFLQGWAAKMAAELAVDSIDMIKPMAERDRQGAVDFVKGAAYRYTKARASIGSDAHDLFERMIRGEAVRRVHPDMEPYRRGFAEFLDAVQPELVSAEDIMWSDAHAYAGSSDCIMDVRLDDNNRPCASADKTRSIVDWKTSKDLHAEVALQLTAYANADRLIKPDGRSEPMPEIEMGAALHITPDGWEFRPVRIDVFEYFLALRTLFDWDREDAKHVIGKPIASSAVQKSIVTGTQRRAR